MSSIVQYKPVNSAENFFKFSHSTIIGEPDPLILVSLKLNPLQDWEWHNDRVY